MPPQPRTVAPTAVPADRWPDVRSLPGSRAEGNPGIFEWHCPATVRWRVVAFACKTQADATGAPRYWELAVTDQNGTDVLAVASAATLPVGAAGFYVAARNWSLATGPDGSGVYTQPLPDVYVEHDWTITATYVGAGVADVIGPANLLVEQCGA